MLYPGSVVPLAMFYNACLLRQNGFVDIVVKKYKIDTNVNPPCQCETARESESGKIKGDKIQFIICTE